ncbi:MAG: DNA polymerase III subunit beta [Clostridiales bacterium]|nr:DNA polymerase III subunit beta [Clostridiales bacterium]
MKLICNGNDLSDAVGKVFKAVGSKTTNPILEHIRLKAEGGALTLSATDQELYIEKSITADVKIEGETLVPGRFFAEFVKKLNREQIELTLAENGRLLIRYQGNEGALSTRPADDFPVMPDVTDAQHFVIIKNELKDLIGKIAFSVSLDDARPLLKGVNLEIEENTLTGVALDGYRLAKCVKPLEGTTAMMSAVVPARSITEIAKLIEDTLDPVTVYVQKRYLMVDLIHTKIYASLLDGDFMNYKHIIPYNFNTVVTLPKEQFEDALERAILLARTDKNNLVKFDIKDDMMELSADSEIGNINEKIVVKLLGNDLTIAFNARYFTEMLRYINCENIVIKFTNSVSPCIVVPSGSVEDFMYLILPVRMA